MKLFLYRFILFIPLFIYANSSVQANPDMKSDLVEDLIRRGREEMLAFKLNAADRTFAQVVGASRNPLYTAQGHYYLSMIGMWRVLCEDSPQMQQTFFERNNKLSQEARFVTDVKWRRFFMAEAAFQKLILLGQQQKFGDAAMAAKNAFDLFERNVQEFPDFYESYKGMGILRIAVGSIPRSYRNWLSMLGYGGSIKQGMADIELAATKSEFVRDEAEVYLAFIELYLNESFGQNMDKIKLLYEANKESPFFIMTYGYILLDKQRANEAERIFLTMKPKFAHPEYFIPQYYAFYLGNIYFRQNRMADAETQFRQYLRDYRGTFLKAEAQLKLALALEMQGKRAEALPLYQGIKAESDFDSDENAKRMATFHIENPLNETTTILLNAQNNFDAGEFDVALQRLLPLLEQSFEGVLYGELQYRLGRIYQAKGQFAESIAHFQKAIEKPGDVLAKWGPWSQYYIGECYEKQGDLPNARLAYRKSLAYKEPFDYHKGLEQRAKMALERLGK